MRIALIGPGDIEFHFKELLKLDDEKISTHLNKIAKAIKNQELTLLPDTGINLELAKIAKEKYNSKIIGVAPLQDKTFGIDHIKENLNIKINNQPLFENIIDSGDWYKHDLIKGLFGDSLLFLGNSPGSLGELNYAIYLFRLLQKRKQGINVSAKYIHQDLKVSENFTIFVYSPFIIKKKLPLELEEYIKKFNIKLVYIKNPKDFEKYLSK